MKAFSVMNITLITLTSLLATPVYITIDTIEALEPRFVEGDPEGKMFTRVFAGGQVFEVKESPDDIFKILEGVHDAIAAKIKASYPPPDDAAACPQNPLVSAFGTDGFKSLVKEYYAAKDEYDAAKKTAKKPKAKAEVTEPASTEAKKDADAG